MASYSELDKYYYTEDHIARPFSLRDASRNLRWYENHYAFGELITEHWVLNKRMDPGCTNEFIDRLIEVMQPHINGTKLAGAGGGGFAIVVAKSIGAVRDLARTLAAHYPGTPVEIWECSVPDSGMLVQTL